MNIISKIKRKGIKKVVLYIINYPIYSFLRLISTPIFLLNRVNEKYIIFTSSPDYSDNSLVLYNYYKSLEKYKNYKFIWLISKESKKLKFNDDENTIFIRLNSDYHKDKNLKALYYISKSKIIFFTHSSPFNTIKKKKNQLIINLWHGCGYKDTRKNKKTYIERHPFDYALVPGKIFIETKKKFWGCKDKKILDIGYPRYDLFFKENINAKKYIDMIKKDNKLIVWMPTFRNTGTNYYPEDKLNKSFDLPLLNSKEELQNLNSLCKESKITICIKRHPLQLKYECEELELSNIIFISNSDLDENNINLYSFLKYTDGLITDYSSIAIDYILLNKPIAFVLEDLDKYANLRGFVFKNPKDYMPGHHLYSYSDLIKFISDIMQNKDIYIKERMKIKKEVHNECDGYCKKIENKISEIIKLYN